jgi:SNF2 family DNA or RNA helicase
MKTLRSHQQSELDARRGQDALPLFWDMRLGKSLLTLRWLCEDLRGPVLVVCPVTPMCGWVRELQDEGLSHTILSRHVDTTEQFCLCSYQTLALNPRFATEIDWDAVVLDESTEIKNASTKVAKLAVRYLSRARRRAVLAGIPDPESRFDLFTQMAFVHGGSWMGSRNFWEWRQRVARKIVFDWIMPHEKEQLVLEEVRATASFLSRKKAGLGSEKVYERRERAMDPDAARELRQVLKTWKSGPREAKHSIAVATWAHRLCGGFTPTDLELPCWKYDELLSLLAGELLREQIVVWFKFSMEMRRAHRLLVAAGVSVTYVQGATDVKQRMARRDAFHRGDRRVFLIQGGCGKFGYDLSAADTEIFFSNSWSSLARRQSEDRIESAMNKSGNLLVIDLVSLGSPDEDVLESLSGKELSSEETAGRILGR